MIARITAIALASSCMLVACSSGPSDAAYAPPVRSTACGGTTGEDGTPPDGSLRAVYPASIHHVVTGDSTLDFSADTLVDICEILGGAFPEGASFLTASTGQYDLTLEDGTVLLWSADLVPGQYEGPGTYTIDGENAPDIAQASGIRSAAYLRLTGPSAGDEGVREYRELVEPCTLTIAEAATSGTVTCPTLGLTTDPSRTISWTWTWERLRASEASPSAS